MEIIKISVDISTQQEKIVKNIPIKSKLFPKHIVDEDVAKNVCPNCNGRLENSGYEHYGYGAGHGFLTRGKSICPVCNKGCYAWEDDDTPGFREHWKGKCCFCKKDIDEWYMKQHNSRG